MDTFGWTDIEDIAITLAETYPDINPVSVRFDQLRELVEQLVEFKPEPGHNVNEQILEAIQAAWIEEIEDADGDAGDDDENDGRSRYKPNDPFR